MDVSGRPVGTGRGTAPEMQPEVNSPGETDCVAGHAARSKQPWRSRIACTSCIALRASPKRGRAAHPVAQKHPQNSASDQSHGRIFSAGRPRRPEQEIFCVSNIASRMAGQRESGVSRAFPARFPFPGRFAGPARTAATALIGTAGGRGFRAA